MNKKNKNLILYCFFTIIVLFIGIGLIFYTEMPNWYREWLTQTPTKTVEYKTKTIKVKKPVYDYDVKAPSTTKEKMEALNKTNLAGQKYLGTIRTMNMHLNTNIYEGINGDILNSGNAVSYPNYDLNKGNSTIAAHTYSVDGWNCNIGFTMIQRELNKGNIVYVYDGNDNYYKYEVIDKQIVEAKNGGYIANPNRNQDKKINPSGKPTLTMYDCYEPVNGHYLQHPTKRNVVILSLIDKYNKDNAPKDVINLFGGLPKYEYKEETKKVPVKTGTTTSYKKVKERIVKVKNAPRLDNYKLRFYDFLFSKLKIQKLFNL